MRNSDDMSECDQVGLLRHHIRPIITFFVADRNMCHGTCSGSSLSLSMELSAQTRKQHAWFVSATTRFRDQVRRRPSTHIDVHILAQRLNHSLIPHLRGFYHQKSQPRGLWAPCSHQAWSLGLCFLQCTSVWDGQPAVGAA
jgi:hypothetical protein